MSLSVPISPQPLARRIVIAFTLMTLVVSGMFALSIVAIVHFVEEHLISQELSRELDGILRDKVADEQVTRLDSKTRFYGSHLPGYSIPPLLTELEDGFSEVVTKDMAIYVFKRTANDHAYLLVREQEDFEAREQVLFDVVLAGFLLSVVGAWGLGWLLARRVMAPVIHLEEQVRHMDQLQPLAPNLAAYYPQDEVGQLAAAFDSTLGQLRHSLERERLFTSDVSHELRTPLMIIASSCELLLEGTNLQPRQREQLTRIERACAEMRDLVQTFLILARSGPEQGHMAGNATLAQVADEQCKRWAPQMNAKGLNFSVREEGSDTARYNLTFLRTVMSNLLRNALHYTDTGSVTLVLETRGFRVEDTGAGIAQEQQERIFQPFTRGPQARGEGLGLGLSLVKRICSYEQWNVEVNSGATGSTFHVTLQ